MTSKTKPAPAPKNPGTAAAMVAMATSQVGYREGSNNDNAFGVWYGMNHEPWCAMFISWAAAKSGCDGVIPKHAYTPAGAGWFKSRDQWHTGTPKVGDIAYFYNSSMGRIAHVEIVVKVNADGSWLSCGGNTNNTGSRNGNGVYLQRRTTTRGGGFGRPRYKAVAAPVEEPTEAPEPAPAPRPATPPAQPGETPDSNRVVAMHPDMVPDARHPQVRILQACLAQLGYGEFVDPLTDFYGPVTQAAVANFHEQNPKFKEWGVRRDTRIGPQGFVHLQKLAGRRV